MTLKTFDGQQIYVTKEQATAIRDAVNGGTQLIEINVGDQAVYVRSGAIATIMPGGDPPVPRGSRIAATHEPTPPEREAKQARAREKLAAMKQDLIERGVLKS